MPGRLSFLTEQVLDVLGSSPRGRASSSPRCGEAGTSQLPLWAGDQSALLWHFLTSTPAPTHLVLLALSAVGPKAALPRFCPPSPKTVLLS